LSVFHERLAASHSFAEMHALVGLSTGGRP
jgi:hypothetical protein